MGVVILLCVFLLFVSHPMAMVAGLVVFVLMVSFYSYFMISTFWFGSLVVLVVLSGMLVVFTYMASLSPNEGFFIDYWSILILMIVSFLFWNELGLEDQSVVSLKFWCGLDGMLNMLMLSLLLLAMLVVVWMSSFWKGAIRV